MCSSASGTLQLEFEMLQLQNLSGERKDLELSDMVRGWENWHANVFTGSGARERFLLMPVFAQRWHLPAAPSALTGVCCK